MASGRGRGRSGCQGRGGHGRPRGRRVLCGRRFRSTRRPHRKGWLRPWDQRRHRDAGLRREPGVRRRLRIPLRPRHPGGGGDQRGRRRGGPGAGLLRRPPVRRAGSQVDHRPRKAGPAGRVRAVVAAAAPHRVGTRQRHVVDQPGGDDRRGPGNGPCERPIGWHRRAGAHPRLDRRVPIARGPLQPRRDPPSDLLGPPRRRGFIDHRIARTARRTHADRRLRRGCPGADGETTT